MKKINKPSKPKKKITNKQAFEYIMMIISLQQHEIESLKRKVPFDNSIGGPLDYAYGT